MINNKATALRVAIKYFYVYYDFSSLEQYKMRLSATEAELHSAMEEYTTGMHADRQRYETEIAMLREQLEKAGNGDDLQKMTDECQK